MTEQINQWQAAWQQLTAPGAPFEVVVAEGGERHFRNAPACPVEALQTGR